MNALRDSRFAHVSLLALAAVPVLSSIALAGGHRADGTFAGNQVHITLGPAKARSNGDYVSRVTTAPGGLNAPHRYFIEVPPGLSTMTVQLFDADLHAGGVQEASTGLDDVGTGTTTCDYLLFDPSGTQVGTTLTATENTQAARNNAWFSWQTIANPAAGHWEVRVDIIGQQDNNAFGVRAFHTSAGTGDTELNVYCEISAPGFEAANVGTTVRSWQEYPYITSGCNCRQSNFDYDSRGSWTLTSRSGNFSTTSAASGGVSGNDVWLQNTISGWTSDEQASDYGIWDFDLTLNGSQGGAPGNGANFINAWFGNFNAVATPTANPPTNAFRTYLPTDGNTAPIKPYVRQYISFVSGSNGPVTNVATRLRLNVEVVNPTPHAITFSNASSRTVTANLPSESKAPGPTPRNYYVGSTVSQGSIISQPTTGGIPTGGSGNIVWDPGTVAAGATASLQLTFDTRPLVSGETNTVAATPASGNGTRAVYLDETGVAGTGNRGVYTFGPLCQVQYTADTGPLLVALDWFTADAAVVGSPVTLRWRTSLEESNAGFQIWRSVDGAPEQKLTSELIPGQGDSLVGAEYEFTDPQALGIDEARAYWLVDIDFSGKSTWHGPVSVGGNVPMGSSVGEWSQY